MQALGIGVYEAHWGAYRMLAIIRAPDITLAGPALRSCGSLVCCHDDGTETTVLHCLNTDAQGLIKSFVAYLESHGHVALISGKKRDLADLLVFDPLKPTLH